jgi:hypothetical protein
MCASSGEAPPGSGVRTSAERSIRIDEPVESSPGLGQQSEEVETVVIAAEDALTAITAGGQMPDCAGEIESERS